MTRLVKLALIRGALQAVTLVSGLLVVMADRLTTLENQTEDGYDD